MDSNCSLGSYFNQEVTVSKVWQAHLDLLQEQACSADYDPANFGAPSCGGNMAEIECKHDWSIVPRRPTQAVCKNCYDILVPKSEQPDIDLINTHIDFLTIHKKHDDINKPAHYNASDIEPIDVIEAWQLPYHLANVIKYLARHKHKGSELKDLKKAHWYLERHIKNIKE